MQIGRLVLQKGGYKAFIPDPFPPKDSISFDNELVELLGKANLNLGKLDGITQTLKQLDFFIFMYVRKEAALSSEIEGTQATMIDSIEAQLKISKELPKDVNDILHYIDAMNFGLKRLESLPLSLRLIQEVHKVLLTKARSEVFAYPGEFRKTPNWIGGTSPTNARYVPPPVYEMNSALSDLEKFLHAKNTLSPLLKTGLVHAQFETIHPFVDGNGRTGRLLVTFYLCQQKVLERPVLYLSEFFKRNREQYFDLLQNYHDKGDVISWLKFFLTGVIEVADSAIDTSKKINILREQDIKKIQNSSRSSKSALMVLDKLYDLPIINVAKIQEWTGFSRASANDLVDKLVSLNILQQREKNVSYGRTFEYVEYLQVFTKP